VGVEIQVLFFRGCPNHEPTVRRIQDIARGLGVHAELREVEVTDDAAARRLRFLGSPTVQVDGKDIEAARRADRGYAMSCRMYGASGVPPREMVEDALAGAAR
jgi:hypothetical protein